MMSAEAVLSFQHLSLEFPARNGASRALDDVNIRVHAGEIVGLVGESGSGKSVAAMCAMGLLQPSSYRIVSGSVSIHGRDVLAMSAGSLRGLRGTDIAMVFQEPMSALNPFKRVGDLLVEVIRAHHPVSRREALERASGMLTDMQIRDVERVLRAYPFELSGGMRQRVVIALAFCCSPRILIADEPTTALDVTVQAEILDLLRSMARRTGTAILFISHDLGVVSALCERIYVMRRGSIVEQGITEDVLGNPRHSYTRALLRALPELSRPGTDLPVAGEAPGLTLPRATAGTREPAEDADNQPMLCVRNLTVRYRVPRLWFQRGPRAVDVVRGVDLSVQTGATLGIIGESGCGKSTLARALVGLVRPAAGQILLQGKDVSSADAWANRAVREKVQMVFQDPQASLNPRMKIWQIITEPLAVLSGISRVERLDAAEQLAVQVGLSREQIFRYPHALSGGQRQRVAIGRALSTSPSLLVLDEPTSALDVSVQARILNLLLQLQRELGLTYIFISHDVAVVRHLADRVAVMQGGRVVESGPALEVLDTPREAYTRKLVTAVPRLRQPRTEFAALPPLPERKT